MLGTGGVEKASADDLPGLLAGDGRALRLAAGLDEAPRLVGRPTPGVATSR
ncbi:hypothetical protein [Cryptosporangium sp. NPDC051539]|uniref:hypothetical protein n=1 Tax=Cryptosporangium sp. NPDC051539 TaxID=3363962 RepID=UPI0037BB9473